MRLALIALPLLLVGCKEEAVVTNNAQEQVSFEQEDLGSDITAIDAATGADFNMAPNEPVARRADSADESDTAEEADVEVDEPVVDVEPVEASPPTEDGAE